MKRSVTSLEAFPFSSRFDQPATADSEKTVSMTADELARLIAETREATAKLVRDEAGAEARAQAARTAESLSEALRTVLHLAEQLESAAIDEYDRHQALDAVRRVAKTLIDGQGELFGDCP